MDIQKKLAELLGKVEEVSNSLMTLEVEIADLLNEIEDEELEDDDDIDEETDEDEEIDINLVD